MAGLVMRQLFEMCLHSGPAVLVIPGEAGLLLLLRGERIEEDLDQTLRSLLFGLVGENGVAEGQRAGGGGEAEERAAVLLRCIGARACVVGHGVAPGERGDVGLL